MGLARSAASVAETTPTGWTRGLLAGVLPAHPVDDRAEADAIVSDRLVRELNGGAVALGRAIRVRAADRAARVVDAACASETLTIVAALLADTVDQDVSAFWVARARRQDDAD
jgi:hypothetical protein